MNRTMDHPPKDACSPLQSDLLLVYPRKIGKYQEMSFRLVRLTAWYVYILICHLPDPTLKYSFIEIHPSDHISYPKAAPRNFII